jgi:hypothetical protein
MQSNIRNGDKSTPRAPQEDIIVDCGIASFKALLARNRFAGIYMGGEHVDQYMKNRSCLI